MVDMGDNGNVASKFLLSSNEAGDVISVNLFDEIYTLGVKVYNPLDTNVSVPPLTA